MGSKNSGIFFPISCGRLKSRAICSCPSGFCSRHSFSSRGGITESAAFVRMNLGMTSGTEGNHQVEDGFAWHPVVHDDLPLPSPGSVADATTVAVTFQHHFPQAAEVLDILPLQGVAGRAQTQRKDLCPSTRAVHGGLSRRLHRSHQIELAWLLQNSHIDQPTMHLVKPAIVAA